MNHSKSITRIILVALMMAISLPQLAIAQGAITPQYMEPTWQAAYWSNMSLAGMPILWRSETQLNYDWGGGSPDWRIPSDHFSARWARYIDLPAGTYRFTATADDGVRVWYDGQLLIDGWFDHPPQTFHAEKHVTSGEHMLMVEYYENGGAAMVQVSWAAVTPEITDWQGEYFNNIWLAGTPALVRNDPKISFSWGYNSPASGVISSDYFAARWTNDLDLPAGLYRFSMTVDDGGRLWVNDQKIIDSWWDSAARTYTGDMYVPGGPVPVRMEYYEHTGIATAQLSWVRIGSQPWPVETIVDDTDPGFVRGGSASGWHVAYTGYGNRLTWTYNNDWARPNYNWARWYPDLPQAGHYEVFVYVPDLYSTTRNARYWIVHRDGYALKSVDQAANGNRWVSLGTYWFQGTQGDYVALNDSTYEPYLSQLIAFDAIKWVPR